MSNKAIVFYTGELLEVQENSLREAHGVENIIFVPIETVDDLNTKILETTEQPFTVYNYLTDPDLIIAVCDKLSNLTADTGFLPEYFIWVDEIKTSRKEGAATQLIGQAERSPITRVMPPESFMTAGIVLSDDVLYGMLFDDVPNCFIYTSSEKNLLSWFNTLIMNLAVSKREFPMLKAVIYAFEDERNQPMLGDDRDHQFVTRHIVTALELFGKTAGIEIFKPNEIEEFKKHIALTDEELEERKLLMAQTQSHDTLHVDVTDMKMPDSIKAVKERVEKFKEMQTFKDIRDSMKDFDPNEPRPDPYLSYGEAIEMCKKGIDVACVNWGADEFLTITHAQIVPANQFWSPSNRRVAEAKPEKSLIVDNYFLRTNKYSTVPYQVSFADMFDEWVVATDRIKVKSVDVNNDEDLSKLTLHYALDTFSTPDFELAPFWIVYDVLAKLPSRVTVISDNPRSELPHIVGSMKEAHDYRQQIVEESYQFDEDGIDDNMYPHRGVDFVCSIGLNDILKRIEAGEFKDVILDDDSFKTEFRLEKIKKALQRTNANWVTVSVKEQLFGITE